MKMERAGDKFWLSIRDCFPIDSGMFSVSLTGHRRQQSAVMSALRGGKAYSDFPICRILPPGGFPEHSLHWDNFPLGRLALARLR